MTDFEQVIAVQSAPAKLSVNFEDVKAALASHLERFDTVVSADGVKDAKAAATEINKLRQSIERRRKDAVAEVSAPIREFEAAMKELSGLCEDARGRLLSQVEQFEDQTRAVVLEALEDLRATLWDSGGVEKQFRRTQIDDLVKISSLTKAGNLTSAASKDVSLRVTKDKALQDLVSARLSSLEGASRDAGLDSPIASEHVRGFVESDDETWQSELDRLLRAEVERQRQTEQRVAAREAARAPDPAPETPESVPGPRARPKTRESAPAASETEGMTRWSVVATFYPEVQSSVTRDRVEAGFRRMLRNAGVTTLAEVEIEPVLPADQRAFVDALDE